MCVCVCVCVCVCERERERQENERDPRDIKVVIRAHAPLLAEHLISISTGSVYVLTCGLRSKTCYKHHQISPYFTLKSN